MKRNRRGTTATALLTADRPKLSPEDIKKLGLAQREKKGSE